MHSRQIIVLLSSIRSRKPLIPHLYRLVIKVLVFFKRDTRVAYTS
ncbi:hypothetical protein HanXRQr2_Chr05g0217951 [Helianthus annuus]|uniref:Uncharacterized protein n=1 Tax=Helianthus annuus TaxID=4232 RepID=A0A9K3NNE2_HELAN|nr:hypothetical protein HanXRQr2_Chr05g0217951 [Helianthus annuus]